MIFKVVTSVMLVWLILSVIGQISVRLLTKMRRYDPFGLLPSWHFFAPNPARFDSIFLIRTCDEKDQYSDWKLPALSFREKWWHSIYNPERRIQKSTHDLQNALGNMADFNSPEVISKSAPAQALLRYITASSLAEPELLKSLQNAKALQFCIVRSEGTRSSPNAEVVFVSAPMSL